MRLDVNAFLGSYPFRRVPGTSPEALLRAMDRTAIDQAWVTHLPGIFWRDPAAGNLLPQNDCPLVVEADQMQGVLACIDANGVNDCSGCLMGHSDVLLVLLSPRSSSERFGAGARPVHPIRVGSLRRTDSVAIEGIADIRRSFAARRSDANDPKATFDTGDTGSETL